MMVWAVGLFAVAALGGVAMMVVRKGEKPVPLGLALVHGLLAASGLVIVAIPVIQGGAAGLVTAAFGVFVVAALGGFYLLATHLREGNFPFGVGLVHGLLAVAGFVLLLLGLYG